MSLLRAVLVLGAAAGSCFAQPPDQVVRFEPASFPDLPRNLATELQRRGCTIPQAPMVEGLHNVIQGEFAKPGQIDWAVLCSANRVSSLLIFWNGSEANPAEIERRPDADSLQGWIDQKIVYSRKITPADSAYIMAHYKAYGGPPPPPMDHLGIDDAFVGKASEVLYFYRGKWLRLTGAD